jgi:hypothetical protein
VLFFLGGLAEVQSGPQFYKYIVGVYALSHRNISSSSWRFCLNKREIASAMFCFIAICISIVYPVTSAFSIIVSELLP